jgi:hypothetical protein
MITNIITNIALMVSLSNSQLDDFKLTCLYDSLRVNMDNISIPINPFSKENKISKLNDLNPFQTSYTYNMLYSIYIIKKDIFDYTKVYLQVPIGYHTNYVFDGTKNEYTKEYGTFYFPHVKQEITPIYATENNKIADWFWQKNMWTVGYLCAIGFNLSSTYLINSIDTSGFSGWIYTVVLNLAELYAISSWIDSFHISDVNEFVPVFTATF